MAIKPPRPGYERHWLDPNFVRKIPPTSAASALYPYLPSHTPSVPSKEAGLLSNAERGPTSPLGGLAVKGTTK